MINTKIKAYQTELLNKMFSLKFLNALFDEERFENLFDEISYAFAFELVEAFIGAEINLPEEVLEYHNQVKSRLGLYNTKWVYEDNLNYSFGYSSEDPDDLAQCAAIISFIRYLVANNYVYNLNKFIDDNFLITQNHGYELIFYIEKDSVAESDKANLAAYPSLNLSFKSCDSYINLFYQTQLLNLFQYRILIHIHGSMLLKNYHL